MWRSVIRNHIRRLAACPRLYSFQVLPVNLPVHVNSHSKFKLNFFFSVFAASWLHNFNVGCSGDLNKPLCIMSECHIHCSFLGIWIINFWIFCMYCMFIFYLISWPRSFWACATKGRCMSCMSLLPLIYGVWAGLYFLNFNGQWNQIYWLYVIRRKLRCSFTNCCFTMAFPAIGIW